VDLGRTNYVFGPPRFLLTSLELPVVSQVITASEDAPYLAFVLRLDISTVRDILNTEEVHVPETSIGARGMAIGETTVELVNACSRLMDLLDAPQDIPFFSVLFHKLNGGAAEIRSLALPGHSFQAQTVERYTKAVIRI